MFQTNNRKINLQIQNYLLSLYDVYNDEKIKGSILAVFLVFLLTNNDINHEILKRTLLIKQNTVNGPNIFYNTRKYATYIIQKL